MGGPPRRLSAGWCLSLWRMLSFILDEPRASFWTLIERVMICTDFTRHLAVEGKEGPV